MSWCINRFIFVVLLALLSMSRGAQSLYAADGVPKMVSKKSVDVSSEVVIRLAGDFERNKEDVRGLASLSGRIKYLMGTEGFEKGTLAYVVLSVLDGKIAEQIAWVQAYCVPGASCVAQASSASTGSLASAVELPDVGSDTDSAVIDGMIGVAKDDLLDEAVDSDSDGDAFDICDADGEPMTSAEIYDQVNGEIETLCRRFGVAAQAMDRVQLTELKNQAQSYVRDPRLRWLAVNRTDDASDLFVDLRNLNIVIDNVLSLDADVTAFVNEVVQASKRRDRATLLSLQARLGKLKADERFKIIERIRLKSLEAALHRTQLFLDGLIARLNKVG